MAGREGKNTVKCAKIQLLKKLVLTFCFKSVKI